MEIKKQVGLGGAFYQTGEIRRSFRVLDVTFFLPQESIFRFLINVLIKHI